MILSKLDHQELRTEALRRDYPKWWSLCLLRSLALPTLNAAFVSPRSSRNEAMRILGDFEDEIGATSVLIRSDGGRESSSYVRAGITYRHHEAIDQIMAFIDRGRSVVLLEPTNRFSNKICINVTIDRNDYWIAEGLGCGFDTSDLQRSLVSPQWGWRPKPTNFGSIRANDFEEITFSNVPHSVRIEQRLNSILELFQWKFHDINEVRNFLIKNGDDCLFSEDERPHKGRVAKILQDAKLVSNFVDVEMIPFTMSYALLWDGREIYWDLTPGQKKWGF